MGLSRAHPGSRIHPPDRRRPPRRRVHGQLAVERVPRDPRPHLRPPVRTGVPARTGRAQQRPRRDARQPRAGGDLPAQAGRRRPQGRRARAHAEAGQPAQRQAGGVCRRRAVVVDRRPRPGPAGLPGHPVRGRSQGRRLHAHPGAAFPPAGAGDRRGMRLHPRPRRGVGCRSPDRIDARAAGRRVRRGVRRQRRAARARPAHPRSRRGRGEHPPWPGLAGERVFRARRRGRQARAGAGRWQHRDGLLPQRAPAGWRGRQGAGAFRLRRDEGESVGEGGCDPRRHPDPRLPGAGCLRPRRRQAYRHDLPAGGPRIRRQRPPHAATRC